MKVNGEIFSKVSKQFFLREIVEGDLELLRKFKNLNKSSFFFKNEISSTDQLNWYKGYLTRKDDIMLIVEQKNDSKLLTIGCMGFRRLEDESIDVYNIMRFEKIENSDFRMGDVFKTMLKYIYENFGQDITCKVLTDNPALSWYELNGFIRISKNEDYYLLKLNSIEIEGVILEK